MWVPLFLAALAILAHLPKLFWDMTNFGGLGVDPAELLRLARGSAHRDQYQRRDEVSTVADVMRRALHGACCCCCSCCCGLCGQKRMECRLSVYLFPAYLFLKVCGMACLLLQLSLLRHFFGLELSVWSYWSETALPSVGLCKLTYQEVTVLQSIVSYCTISTNVLTEKVVLLLSIYFPLVLSISALSLLLWIYRLTLCRLKFLAKHALLDKCHLGDNKTQKRSQLLKLDKDFLGTNGIFLLHLMEINAGEVFTSELVGDLYRGFFAPNQNNPAADAAVRSAVGNEVSERLEYV